MRERKRRPAHPGGILRRQYLEPLGLTVSELARVLGVSRTALSNLVNEHTAVSADMALRLSRAFETTPELWLNLQRNHDLWQAARTATHWKRIRPVTA